MTQLFEQTCVVNAKLKILFVDAPCIRPVRLHIRQMKKDASDFTAIVPFLIEDSKV